MGHIVIFSNDPSYNDVCEIQERVIVVEYTTE